MAPIRTTRTNGAAPREISPKAAAASCTLMWKFVARTLDDPQTFTAAERAQIQEWVKTIIRDRHRPDVSGDGSPYYLVTEKAVAWVVAHAKPIRCTPDPRITR